MTTNADPPDGQTDRIVHEWGLTPACTAAFQQAMEKPGKMVT